MGSSEIDLPLEPQLGAATLAGSDRPRKTSVTRAQLVTVHKDHPIAPTSGRVAYCRLALFDKIGPGTHSCHWCGGQVTWKIGRAFDALVVDHLDWNPQNDAAENLVPSCNSCNARRASPGKRSAIRDDEPSLLLPSGYRTRATERICIGCGVRFYAVPSKRGKYHSRDCWKQHARKTAPGTALGKEQPQRVKGTTKRVDRDRCIEVRERYEQGIQTEILAAEYGVTTATIRNWVRAAGGTVRPPGGAGRQRRKA